MLSYHRGDPPEAGVYACRIHDPDDMNQLLKSDIFLLWMDHDWWYPRSDQRYRGEVLGWIGPLERQIR